jgi:hypothetical protein
MMANVFRNGTVTVYMNTCKRHMYPSRVPRVAATPTRSGLYVAADQNVRMREEFDEAAINAIDFRIGDRSR